jgi:hypothetical protein
LDGDDGGGIDGIAARAELSMVSTVPRGGVGRLADRSSAPHRHPQRICVGRIAEIACFAAVADERSGDRQRELAMPVSTVSAILLRLGLSRLAAL